MGGVGSLVAQQVAVGSGLAEAAEAVVASFTKRERDGAVGKLPLDVAHDVAHNIVGKPGILAALQHKGAEAELAPRAAAVENLLLAEAVALHRQVAAPYSAVEAVVLAVVADFDKAAHEYLPPVHLVAHAAGFGEEFVDGLRVRGGEQVLYVI